MQPSARGRLRAAGRTATEFADNHFLQKYGCVLRRLLFRSRKFKMKNEELKMNCSTQC